MGYPSKLPNLQNLLKKIPQNQLVPKPVIKAVEDYERINKSDPRMKFREARAIIRLYTFADEHLNDFHKLVHDFNGLFGQKFDDNVRSLRYTLITGDTEKVVYQPLPPLLKLKHFKKSQVDEMCHILMYKIHSYLIPSVQRILEQFVMHERWVKNALELVIRSEGELGKGHIAYELSSLQSKGLLLKALPLTRKMVTSIESIEHFMEQNFRIFVETYNKPTISRLKEEL